MQLKRLNGNDSRSQNYSDITKLPFCKLIRCITREKDIILRDIDLMIKP